MSVVLWPFTEPGSSGPWTHLEVIPISHPACIWGHIGMRIGQVA